MLEKQGATEGQTLYVFFCEVSGVLRPVETGCELTGSCQEQREDRAGSLHLMKTAQLAR